MTLVAREERLVCELEECTYRTGPATVYVYNNTLQGLWLSIPTILIMTMVAKMTHSDVTIEVLSLMSQA